MSQEKAGNNKPSASVRTPRRPAEVTGYRSFPAFAFGLDRSMQHNKPPQVRRSSNTYVEPERRSGGRRPLEPARFARSALRAPNIPSLQRPQFWPRSGPHTVVITGFSCLCTPVAYFCIELAAKYRHRGTPCAACTRLRPRYCQNDAREALPERPLSPPSPKWRPSCAADPKSCLSQGCHPASRSFQEPVAACGKKSARARVGRH